jgi:type I protein arginine methyltransferase
VIAVDNSGIIDQARVIVWKNGYDDKITLIRGKIEDIILPVKEVDIIVSEWMGYALLYEGMLDSVLWARDRYLKRDGLMVPSTMTLQIACVKENTIQRRKVSFWKDVYGFDMSAMVDLYKTPKDAVQVEYLEKENTTQACGFAVLDLHTITVAGLSFTAPFAIPIASTDVSKEPQLAEGFLIWFDTFFFPSRDIKLSQPCQWTDLKVLETANLNVGTPRFREQDHNRKHNIFTTDGACKIVTFTTGPGGEETHWHSALLPIDCAKNATPGPRLDARDIVRGNVKYAKPSASVRWLEITVDWELEDGKMGQQTWTLDQGSPPNPV